MFRNVFVFFFFRDFVMSVFDPTLDVDYWIFETNKWTTFNQDLTLEAYGYHLKVTPASGPLKLISPMAEPEGMS